MLSYAFESVSSFPETNGTSPESADPSAGSNETFFDMTGSFAETISPHSISSGTCVESKGEPSEWIVTSSESTDSAPGCTGTSSEPSDSSPEWVYTSSE